MKFKRTVLLASVVVMMGLLLGTSAPQAAEVIFEGNTATGIEDLLYNDVFYDVTFVYQTGNSLYGPKGEGEFPFAGLEGDESAATEEATYGAGRAIQETLNASSQAITRVGPQSVDYFFIAGGEENTDPGNEDTPWVYGAFTSTYYDIIVEQKRPPETWVPADNFFIEIELTIGGGYPPIKIELQPWPLGMAPPLEQDVPYSWAKIEPAAGSPPPADTTVGGNVTGLEGTGLVLQNNVADDEPISADGAFTFDTSVTPGTNYSVTVKTQPSNPAQKCTVAKGWGTVPGGGVDDVLVTCADMPEEIISIPPNGGEKTSGSEESIIGCFCSVLSKK